MRDKSAGHRRQRDRGITIGSRQRPYPNEKDDQLKNTKRTQPVS